MAQAKQIISVLMADDHAIFRDGVRKLLEDEDDIQIVGEASNGNECVR
jgi:DNA-binding NarL/FixJ family response regulator